MKDPVNEQENQKQELPQQSAGTAERVMEHLDAAHTRHKNKKAAQDLREETTLHMKSSRLQFTDEERAAPELEKYIRKSDKAADRLDTARAALPKQKKLIKERTYNEATGKGKTRLRFEEQEKPAPGGKQHKNPLSRPTQEAGIFVHNKIHSVEKDNAGVEGAHKTEELAERGARYGVRKIRQGYHSRKLKPYRKAAKAEKAAFRANVNVKYRKALRDNPQLSSNPVSRLWQKRQIKKQYAQALRKGGTHTARKAAAKARKVARKAAEETRKKALFVARHPVGVAIAIGVLLLFVMLFAGLSSCASMFSGGVSSVVGTSYVAEDAAMIGAETDYAALEATLQSEIDAIEETHSGYDEYRYDLDAIEHDPYVLTSILSALHLEYTRAGVQDTLKMLFEKQYILTLTEEVETRYRTETRTGTRTVIDPETGREITETYEYEVQIPYEYRILHIALENFNLSHLPVYIMDEKTLSLYAGYMQTHGNRPDLFPNGSYPHASTLKEPTYYEVPPEALKDATFAAMLTEAEKYLGYPYVWGGSSPSTSFDCSGFVSWIINHSGWNVGRLGAQGLYNICTPVTAAQAKPGDLIFFQGTYDTTGVSHVGLYVGGGMMIHCGDPISYANVNTSYWQNHFYAYGRLP